MLGGSEEASLRKVSESGGEPRIFLQQVGVAARPSRSVQARPRLTFRPHFRGSCRVAFGHCPIFPCDLCRFRPLLRWLPGLRFVSFRAFSWYSARSRAGHLLALAFHAVAFGSVFLSSISLMSRGHLAPHAMHVNQLAVWLAREARSSCPHVMGVAEYGILLFEGVSMERLTIWSHEIMRITPVVFFLRLDLSASRVAKPSMVVAHFAASRTHIARNTSRLHDVAGSRGSAMRNSSAFVELLALGRGSSICRFARSSNERAIGSRRVVTGGCLLPCGRGAGGEKLEPFLVQHRQVYVRTFPFEGKPLTCQGDLAGAVIKDAT